MIEHKQQPVLAANHLFCERIAEAINRAGNWLAGLPPRPADMPSDRRSRFLAWTILLLLFLMLLTFVIVLLTTHSDPARRLLYIAIPIVMAGLLTFSFLFNRRRKYRLAALIVVLSCAAANWAAILLDQNVYMGQDIVPLFYVALSILLASFLLSSWETSLLALLQMIGLAWLLQRQDAWTQINWPSLFTFLLFTLLLSLSIHHIMRADMRQIERQNRRLLKDEAMLKELVTRDSLTKLYNRYYLDETLPREISRAERSGNTLAVIMLDIDHFKTINDRHGHAVGDELLRLIGSILAGKKRESDIACRYGGDEFILVMPDASLQAGYSRADSIRKIVGNRIFQIEAVTIAGVTLSCGVANYPNHGLTGSDVLRKADKALYRAKHNGRDRTEAAGP